MAAMIRVGAGALVDRRFQPDVLEEIRIMAEAAQASLVGTTVRPGTPDFIVGVSAEPRTRQAG